MIYQRTMLALALGAVLAATGCVVYEPAHVHREVIVAQGPPPGAVIASPRPGRWHKMTYRYFPEEQVYYNVELGRWYWQEDARWCDAPVLPHPIRLGLHSSVMIDLDGDRPRMFHNRVLGMYPPPRGPYSSRR